MRTRPTPHVPEFRMKRTPLKDLIGALIALATVAGMPAMLLLYIVPQLAAR